MRGDHRGRGAIGLVPVLVVTGIALASAGVGAGLVAAGVLGDDRDVVIERSALSRDAVDLSDCPDGTDVGAVHRGDRVLVTGQGDSGTWVEIRHPNDLTARAWIRVEYLVPDTALTRLDVSTCTGPTTTTAPLPAAATTTAPKDSGTPGTTGPTPPASADTTGPTISSVTTTPNKISEADSPGDKCSESGSLPTKSTVSAAVSDPSGVATVTMNWQVASTGGSKPMSGSTYTATLGTFPASTIPQDTTAAISVTISALDVRGNSSTSVRTVTLEDCTFI